MRVTLSQCQKIMSQGSSSILSSSPPKLGNSPKIFLPDPHHIPSNIADRKLVVNTEGKTVIDKNGNIALNKSAEQEFAAPTGC